MTINFCCTEYKLESATNGQIDREQMLLKVRMHQHKNEVQENFIVHARLNWAATWFLWKWDSDFNKTSTNINLLNNIDDS